jgi:hypothetical protein
MKGYERIVIILYRSIISIGIAIIGLVICFIININILTEVF